jgi:SAM-dependent methyltransferase
MSNPWLRIPLDDYEGHMSLPEVGQAQMIAEQLDCSLERWAPASIAVVGCAGGNGLDTIARRTVERVVAVDVNPDYIERTRARHAHQLQGLELVCADVQSESLIYVPVVRLRRVNGNLGHCFR